MNKKALALLMVIVVLGLSIMPVEAEGMQGETLNISTEFIKESEVEVSQQGYLKFTRLDKSNVRVNSEKEAEVLVLIPEDEDNIEDVLKAINDIKNGKCNSADSKEFIKMINTDNSVQISSSSGSGTKEKTGWGCQASLTISYKETVINGKDAVLLKKVSTKIKNGQSVYVSGYKVNYGCSGTTPKQNFKTQNGEKSYGYVRASSTQSKTIHSIQISNNLFF